MQGVQVHSLVRELKIPRAMWCGKKKKNTNGPPSNTETGNKEAPLSHLAGKLPIPEYLGKIWSKFTSALVKKHQAK